MTWESVLMFLFLVGLVLNIRYGKGEAAKEAVARWKEDHRRK